MARLIRVSFGGDRDYRWIGLPVICIFLLSFIIHTNEAQAIRGGLYPTPGTYKNLPFVAFLSDRAGTRDRDVCTGILINKNTILTAARCFDESDAITNITLVRALDINAPNREIQTVSKSQIRLHPGYVEGGKFYDIAVVKLHQEFQGSDQFIYPALTSSVDFEKFIFWGYGFDETQKIGALKTNHRFKDKILPARSGEEHLISFDQTDLQGISTGDTGGPVITVVNKRAYIVAVNKLIIDSANGVEGSAKGVTTKLSPDIIDWVRTQMRATDLAGNEPSFKEPRDDNSGLTARGRTAGSGQIAETPVMRAPAPGAARADPQNAGRETGAPGSANPAAPVSAPSAGAQQPTAAAVVSGNRAVGSTLPWPTITTADLTGCRREIAEFHRLEIAYWRNQAAEEQKRFDKLPAKNKFKNAQDNKRIYLENANQSSRVEDMAWFAKGNDGCEGSDYPCFGLSVFNKKKIGAERERWIGMFRDMAKAPVNRTSDLWEFSFVVNACVAKAWVAKLDGTPTPTTTAGKNSSRPVAGTVLRDRPDGPPPAASQTSSKKEKRQHVPDAVATKCLSLNKKPGYGGFVNSCSYAVEYTYCAYRPKDGAWSESFDCEKNQLGSWTVGPNGTDAAHTKAAEKIHWVACRYKGQDGKPIGVSPMDVKWDHQKRTLTFRCGEWGTGGT